jgi:hypothetical protein
MISRQERADRCESLVGGFEEWIVAELGEGDDVEVGDVFAKDSGAGDGGSVAFAV